MAITDIDISETLEAGAPSIKYTGDMDPNIREPNMQVASDPSWEAEWEDLYQNYKIKQIELGQEFVSKEEFMEDYQNNMASGGRVNFGLGSIFKSVGKAAKKFVKSPIGKAALLGLGAYGANAGWFGGGMKGWGAGLKSGLFGQTPFRSATAMMKGAAGFPGTEGILGKLGLTAGKGSMMPSALGWGAGAVAAGMGAQAFENMSGDEINALKNDPAALRSYLKQYHTNTHPDKSEEEVDIWVEQNMYSTGGRVGYADGNYVPKDQRKDPDEVIAGMDNELNPSFFDMIPLIGGYEGKYPVDKDQGSDLINEIQKKKYGYDYEGEEIRSSSNPERPPMSMEETIKALEAKWDEAVEDDWGFGYFDYMGVYEKEDIRRRVELGFDQAKGPGTNTGIMAAAEGGRINFGGGSRGWQAQLKAEDIAQEDFGQEFYSLSEAQQHKVYNKALVEIDDMLSEKADMMRKNEAQGGRIGYDDGGSTHDKLIIRVQELQDEGLDFAAAMAQAREELQARDKNAHGGRTGFAYGPDQTAEAAGIMGQLPVRNNGAGVKELDLRDSGGFIPPVGVKEKADDIPAMLSNNEFVFTADAVKAAGGGSVEKGAQVMYDQMKKLENKVA